MVLRTLVTMPHPCSGATHSAAGRDGQPVKDSSNRGLADLTEA